MEKQPRDFKKCQGTHLDSVPLSMNTTDACSLFPRNVTNLTVGPALGCEVSGNPILGRLLPSWLAFHKADADIASDGLKAHQ